MTRYFTQFSFTATWLLVLMAALWIAVGTSSVVAWASLVLIAMMPPLMLMVLAQTPAKTIAEIIHDTETGRSR